MLAVIAIVTIRAQILWAYVVNNCYVVYLPNSCLHLEIQQLWYKLAQLVYSGNTCSMDNLKLLCTSKILKMNLFQIYPL